MRRWSAAIGAMTVAGFLLGSGAVCGCGKEKAAQGDSTGSAGSVISLEGNVSATREGGSSRSLAQGSEVFADDVVATQAGASITIRLNHNNVDWQLGESLTKQVQTSAAWRAPKSNSAPVLAGNAANDPNVAAGRHSEREAGEGASTAIANTTAGKSADDPSPAPTPSVPVKTGFARNDKPIDIGSVGNGGAAPRGINGKTAKRARPPSKPPRGKGSPSSPPSDDADSAMQETAALGAKKEADPVLKDPTVRIGGSPSGSGMALIRKTIRLCYKRSKASGKGQFMTAIKVDKKGTITSVKSGSAANFDSSATLKKMKSCVEKALLGKTAVGVTERATSAVRFK